MRVESELPESKRIFDPTGWMAPARFEFLGMAPPKKDKARVGEWTREVSTYERWWSWPVRGSPLLLRGGPNSRRLNEHEGGPDTLLGCVCRAGIVWSVTTVIPDRVP